MGSQYEALGPGGGTPPGPPAPPPAARAPQPLLAPGQPTGPKLVGKSIRSERTATEYKTGIALDADLTSASVGRDDKDKSVTEITKKPASFHRILVGLILIFMTVLAIIFFLTLISAMIFFSVEKK